MCEYILYIYIYIYIYISECVCVFIDIYVYVCFTYIYVCVYVCIYLYIYVFILLWKNPESDTPQNSRYRATYLPSHESSKWEEQDMNGTAGEVKINS